MKFWAPQGLETAKETESGGARLIATTKHDSNDEGTRPADLHHAQHSHMHAGGSDSYLSKHGCVLHCLHYQTFSPDSQHKGG